MTDSSDSGGPVEDFFFCNRTITERNGNVTAFSFTIKKIPICQKQDIEGTSTWNESIRLFSGMDTLRRS